MQLFEAVARGDAAATRAALDVGANPNCALEIEDDIFETVVQKPLHLSIQKGHLECSRVLLERGADVNAENDVRSPCGARML